jgi:hypothetical protein
MRKGTPTAKIDEKRVEPRVDTTLSVTVIAGKRSVAFTVDNLSATGARLIGPLPLTMGQQIRVILPVDTGPLELAAEVVRIHTADLVSDQVAVRFSGMTAAAVTAIRGLVLRSLQPAGGSEVDDEGVTSRLPKSEIDLDAATMRYAKKKDRP